MLDFGFYNADCMEHLKDFPDKYFELAIVDPPYGINIGSASSLIACERLGFQYVGFEIDEEYYNLALERLEEERAQVKWKI